MAEDNVLYVQCGIFLSCFSDRIPLYGYAETHSVARTGLELTDIHIPLPPKILELKAHTSTA